MKRHILAKATILGIFCLAILAGSQAFAQTTLEASFQWTAPTTGAPVDHYVVQHRVDSGAWVIVGSSTTNTYTMNLAVGQSHEIRVAGVDADGRQGEYSDPSDPYVPDLGAPGKPGKPILF